MSLINDALKKAQKMRSHEQGGAAPQPAQPSSGRGEFRRPGMGFQWILLIVTGSAVLVSVSVFATVYFLRKPVSSITIKPEERVVRAPEPASATLKSEQSQAPQPVGDASSPLLILPSAAPTAPASKTQTSAEEPKAKPVETIAPKSVKEESSVVATATPSIERRAVPPSADPLVANTASTEAKATTEALSRDTRPAPAPEPARANPKAQAFVDALKVTGIRAAGAESKVLMNDRVYRVNDVVDRTLGLRIVEVSTERLVFVDEAGNRYVRNF